ncbi:hypothetical protein D918_06308 [Trichuris suis]|nr:hypothetical protein D918_06308 [Trichuris suis]
MHDSLRIGYTILLVDRSLRFEFKTVSCSDYTPPGRCRRYLHLADSLNLWTLMYTLLMSHMKRTDPRLQFEPAANSCLVFLVQEAVIFKKNAKDNQSVSNTIAFRANQLSVDAIAKLSVA